MIYIHTQAISLMMGITTREGWSRKTYYFTLAFLCYKSWLAKFLKKGLIWFMMVANAGTFVALFEIIDF